LWRLYTSQVVILQVVASVELTILMPGTVVDSQRRAGMPDLLGENACFCLLGSAWVSCTTTAFKIRVPAESVAHLQ
jgi:hypothetical protein